MFYKSISDWNVILTDQDSQPDQTPKFAHDIEAEFARILDYYGIAWEYEPRTFELAWDEDGNVTEAFSPDFYLPEQDRYIELTTMRPKLITKKNRKIRRMNELYPDIDVKLFKRSDLRQMMTKYDIRGHTGMLRGTDAQNKES